MIAVANRSTQCETVFCFANMYCPRSEKQLTAPHYRRCVEVDGRADVYGLHRWQPTLCGVWQYDGTSNSLTPAKNSPKWTASRALYRQAWGAFANVRNHWALIQNIVDLCKSYTKFYQRTKRAHYSQHSIEHHILTTNLNPDLTAALHIEYSSTFLCCFHKSVKNVIFIQHGLSNVKSKALWFFIFVYVTWIIQQHRIKLYYPFLVDHLH